MGMPRPKAYPRITLYPDSLTDSHHLPCGWMVNDSATVRIWDDDTKADITYPRYDATIHCTFTHVGADTVMRDHVMDNRLERMALNVGAGDAEQLDITSPGGFQTILLTTLTPSITPVQFISVGPKWIVSGALHIDAAATQPDSVAPIIEAVKLDIINAAKHLQD